MSVEVCRHEPGRDTADFIRAGDVVYGNDLAWVPPLHMVIGDRLNPKKEPFYRHGEVALFTARKRGRLAGRISATVDWAWLNTWRDDTGHFGYFDTVDDIEVARALLEAAEAWLRQRGMKRMNGPMSLSANQEIGMLIEGFDEPPQIDMGHARRYQSELTEGCGLTKEKDLYAWRYIVRNGLNDRTLKAWKQLRETPEVRLRSVDLHHLRRELDVVMEIYNETWRDKWGYVPISAAELDKMASDLSLVLDPDIAFIAEIDGKPAGMCIMVPNLNEAIADLGGKMFPFGWTKLLWRTKVRHPTSARLILLWRSRIDPPASQALRVSLDGDVRRRGEARARERIRVGRALMDA
jgi:hypothetical protein